MLLNPLSLNYVIWLPANFFYNDVVKVWKPVLKRMYLPYLTLEDMFNSQITAISFPSVTTTNVTQGLLNYTLTKRGGKTLDQSMAKNLTLTIKLSESYITYWIARQLFDLFLQWGEKYQNLYLPLINVTILDEDGFENVTYAYYQVTPESISDFDLSYSAKPGSFNTFTWGFSYNYFEIWYRNEEGARTKMDLDVNHGMLSEPGQMKLKDNSRAITRDNNEKMFKELNLKNL